MGPLTIRGGRVIDPASGLDRVADLLVRDGRIARIGPVRSPIGEVIDADGCLVCPGLIDPHVHLREPGQTHKEDIVSGSAAAVAGGFTSICCMPNTSPPLDEPAIVQRVIQRARQARCRVFPVAAATVGRAGQRPSPIRALHEAGAVAFSDDGDAVADSQVMAAVLREIAAVGSAFMQHCQDPAQTRGAQMHAGPVAVVLGLRGWPREAETSIIERDIGLVRSIGARYHVQHCSCAESVDLIRRARAAGLPVTAEASPHHLLLTHQRVLTPAGPDPMAKVNPPLREQADVDALRRGVAEGTITVLATDHAPHAAWEKDQPFERAPMGMIGLETALPLYATALIQTGMIDWPRLIAMMTVEPARLCGLDRMGLGRLAEGGPADVTVIDPEVRWEFTADEAAGRSANSPFLGMTLKGRAVATVVAGRTVHVRREAGARA